jgi:CHAT domain-containing protein/Tfp pilus assembly protein PilF
MRYRWSFKEAKPNLPRRPEETRIPGTRVTAATALPVFLLISYVSFGRAPARFTAQDEPAIRTIVEKYFAFYANKDLQSLLALWDQTSSSLPARKTEIEKLFGAPGTTSLKRLTIAKLNFDGNRAIAQVSLEIGSEDKAVQTVTQINRILRFIRREGRWWIDADLLAEEELASEIAASNDDEARRQLLENRKELVDRTLWELLSARAREFFQRADYAKSLGLLEINRRIAELLSDKQLVARTLNNTGIIYQWRGDYPAALDHFKRSLDLAESIGLKPAAAAALSNMAKVYSLEGDYQAALDYGQKALALNESLGAPKPAGDSELGIGDAYYLRGDHRRALHSYQQALAIYQEIGDQFSTARALGSVGNVHRGQGNYLQALEFYRKSLSISEAIGDRAAVAASLGNVGLVLQQQGDYSQAVEYLKRALAVYETIGVKSGEAYALAALGHASLSGGSYQEALEYFNKSLDIFDRIGDKPGAGVALNELAAVCLAQQNPQKALELAERAVDLERQTESIESLWRAQTNLGRAFRSLGEFDKAQHAFEQAIASIEDLRSDVAGGEQESERFFESRTAPYYEMIGLLVSQGRTREAFAYSEKVRARVVLDVLRRGRVSIAKAMTVQERDQERRLTETMSTLNRRIYSERLHPGSDAALAGRLAEALRKARLEHEAFQTTLYTNHPELRLRRGESRPISIQETATLLTDPHSAALEFAVTERATYLFVLTRNDKKTAPVVDVATYVVDMSRKDLTHRIQMYVQRLANHDNDFQELSASLFDLLLKPAELALKNKTLLVIAPDGPLWNLPFQTLKSTDGHYLIESAAISYAPSFTVLSEMIRRTTAKRTDGPSPSLLALGNPYLGESTLGRSTSVVADQSLEPLPEAERQVKALASLFGSRARIYIGAEAREDLLKAEATKYQILHLATHGVLDDSSPMYSNLVLSQTPGKSTEDGLLEAWEIMDLDLKADLAVLSACETGRGRIGGGEGVIGLAWAFFVAGCPATVVSKWDVESASTTEFMLEFYTSLKSRMDNPKSGTTRAEDLRQAALKLIHTKTYHHPFYWGGFVIVGDPF